MAKDVGIGRSVAFSRDRDFRLSIDDLEDFPATTVAKSTFALSIMDDQIRSRSHVESRVTAKTVLEIIQQNRATLVTWQECVEDRQIGGRIVGAVIEVERAEEEEVRLSGGSEANSDEDEEEQMFK